MNTNIENLLTIANKEKRMILGLMSGTSLDGLDAALCSFKGSGNETEIELISFETIPFSNNFKKEIKSIFSNRNADLEKVCILNAWIAREHAAIINSCLKKWKIGNEKVDLLASHGQTVYHAPKILHGIEKFPNATLQIGDGDHLAVATGIITVSDFRQKHIAAGGEGAPLAVYGDYFIFSKKNENRIMLNIGGIANFTFLPGNLDASEVFCTDTGTGNTLMDAYVQQNFEGRYFDEAAEIAKKGTVNNALLLALKEHDFFFKKFPKTTGPELFNLDYLEKAKQKCGSISLSHEDTMATLNRFSADTIANALNKCIKGISKVTVYSSGGGMHNPLLMQHIREQVPGVIFKDTNSLNIHPDAKEAVLFAVLANECIAGGKIQLGKGNKGIPGISMGKISFPF